MLVPLPGLIDPASRWRARLPAHSLRRLLAPAAAALFGLLWIVPAPAQSQTKTQPEQFSIVNARMLDFDGGYSLPPDTMFAPGEQIYLEFNIGGYHSIEYEYRMKVSYMVEFIGASGAPFAPSESGVIDEEVYGQDEGWMPIVRASPRIPSHAEAGTYKIVIRARDEHKPQNEDRRELAFTVLGPTVSDADALAIRDFGLARSEDGESTARPSFRPGDALWGRFSITGFALGEGNTFKVDSRLRIVNEEEEVLYAFTPEGDQGKSFYPRRWLPARFRVDLDADVPAGQYTIVLLVHDHIGGRQSEMRYPFEIR